MSARQPAYERRAARAAVHAAGRADAREVDAARLARSSRWRCSGRCSCTKARPAHAPARRGNPRRERAARAGAARGDDPPHLRADGRGVRVGRARGRLRHGRSASATSSCARRSHGGPRGRLLVDDAGTVLRSPTSCTQQHGLARSCGGSSAELLERADPRADRDRRLVPPDRLRVQRRAVQHEPWAERFPPPAP